MKSLEAMILVILLVLVEIYLLPFLTQELCFEGEIPFNSGLLV